MQAVTHSGAQAPAIVLSPIRAGLPVGGGTLEVLVRVQAPTPSSVGDDSAGPAVKVRPPLRLALVVDRSGSMDGEPLSEALRCVDHIAGRLTMRDQLAVLFYDGQVQVPLPLATAGCPDLVHAALTGVDSGGCTDLHAGWEAGARQLETGPKGSLSRVILLSDGQANSGLVDQAQIEQQCARWLDAGVSTTTVGLGRGFNEELMLGMARAGGGQQYYGQAAEDLFDGFDQELALLEAMFLRKLRINLVPGPGVVVEALGQVQQSSDGRYMLSDLAWSAESWLLVRLHVVGLSSNDPQKPLAGTLDARALLSVTLHSEDMAGVAVTRHSSVLALPSLDLSACNDLPKNSLVAQRLQEVQFGASSDEARALLLAGDEKGAKRKLARMEAEVADHPWLREKLAQLRELTERDAAMSAKELRYSGRSMSRRLTAVDEPMFLMEETQRLDIPAYLRRKGAEGKGRSKP